MATAGPTDPGITAAVIADMDMRVIVRRLMCIIGAVDTPISLTLAGVSFIAKTAGS